MILPSKHIKTAASLIWIGAILISNLKTPKSVGLLWEEVKKNQYIRDYRRFILALDFLYLVSAIEIEDGLLAVKGK